MLFKKIIKLTIVLLLLGVVVWYFFIKDYNYKVTFRTRQVPGVVYSEIINWNERQPDINNAVITLEKTPFNVIKQELRTENSILKIHWVIKKENDSTTLVTAKIKEEGYGFKQNIEVLYSKNDFVKRSIKAVQSVKNVLELDAEKFRVSHVEADEIPSSHCVCTTIESKIHEKALQMINHSDVPLKYIRLNNFNILGHPFLEVTSWNLKDDVIKFDFCFPIAKEESYPDSKNIIIKDLVSEKALKVKFYGNYGISDRGWFTIIDYANSKGISLDFKPVEVFKKDPHEVGD
jgi:hypothetical protein